MSRRGYDRSVRWLAALAVAVWLTLALSPAARAHLLTALLLPELLNLGARPLPLVSGAPSREEIAREHDKAQTALKNEVVALAMEIASKVVREELTADKHRRLVDGFLTELEQAR